MLLNQGRGEGEREEEWKRRALDVSQTVYLDLRGPNWISPFFPSSCPTHHILVPPASFISHASHLHVFLDAPFPLPWLGSAHLSFILSPVLATHSLSILMCSLPGLWSQKLLTISPEVPPCSFHLMTWMHIWLKRSSSAPSLAKSSSSVGLHFKHNFPRELCLISLLEAFTHFSFSLSIL